MASDEWYTPEQYTAAAREVMGSIDLDPASCAEANTRVNATRFYTQQDNGLVLPWSGRVWLNCPFSAQKVWAARLLQAYDSGEIEQAVFLCQAATERRWFKGLWRFPICFADHQVLFHRPHDRPYHIYHGVCFVYLGPNESDFNVHFKKFGAVVKGV